MNMKRFIIAAVALSLIHPAFHAAAKTPAATPQQNQEEKKKQKQQEKEARDKKRAAVQVVLDAKDKNHDGSLTLEEYLTGEADAAAATKTFEKYNKNKDRTLTKAELSESLGL
jgi:hypothetical protein